MDWDKEEDEEEEEEDLLSKMTPAQTKMYCILEDKKSETIMMLLSKLSRRNEDVEFALNAQAVLFDLSENENTYSRLLQTINLEYLID